MTHLDHSAIEDLFNPVGPISLLLKGYEKREEQLAMMKDVVDAFNDHRIALIEAGTGTGKSLAYLVPAVIKAVYHQERVLISTRTINLQEQLLFKDLPLVEKLLGVDVSAVLVKGMGNYFCKRKGADLERERHTLRREEYEQFERILAWESGTKDGSRSDIPFFPNAHLWDKINCESDTCTYRKCPFQKECYFFEAREKAKNAKILISNHYLLFADIHIRSTKTSEEESLLPPYQHVIMDEAHHTEDVATEFFADRISRTHLLRTMGKISSERVGKDEGRLHLLKKKIASFYGKGSQNEIKQILSFIDVTLPLFRREVLEGIADFFQAMTLFVDQQVLLEEEGAKLRLTEKHYKNTFWKKEVVTEAEKLVHALKQYINGLERIIKQIKEMDLPSFQEQSISLLTEISAYTTRLESQCNIIEKITLKPLSEDYVRWVESYFINGFCNIHLIEATLDISEFLATHFFDKMQTAVLCSATMATSQNFSFIKKQVGIESETLSERGLIESIYSSPFDYKRQLLLVVPKDVPNPLHDQFDNAASECILKAVKASHGNAFVLFTSYSQLKNCYTKIYEKLLRMRFVVMKQGDDQRGELLKKFRKTERSVLFATDSFWEGVDVIGEALRCVILVKIPFKVPSEPVFQARSEKIKREGMEPFWSYALPSAIVKFKQGFGRLIRHKKDRGVVVVLDSRLITKGYGKQFLSSLPNCERAFIEQDQMEKTMSDFYRKTYKLTK